MAGLPSSGYKGGRTAENDLYTAMTIIAFAFVLAAFIFVIIRSNELFDTPFPGFAG